ncbi:hypothetical protein BD410DRAFT_745707 [Rickenella mellea]|uniref:DUF1746 domain-containing protein n=1 Tax=Rickenella mellea TaxID=50990 RepID=A0A4Y7QA35_9AGAM|nr:hypothetical protein BD410DRAFT_745707 [Rickenella mellea]
MPIPHHAQRKHIISSLDHLLYQLHTLSFLLAPSMWIYACRCATQFHCSKVRDLDVGRSLRFWFAAVLLCNAGAVWSHALDSPAAGAAAGRGLVLDFVGMSHTPSRWSLLLLDVTITSLQAILTTLAYETSLTIAMPDDVPDPLLPKLAELHTTNSTANITYDNINTDGTTQPSSPNSPSAQKNPLLYAHPPNVGSEMARGSPLIVDLRARHIFHRLTHAVPEPPPRVGATANGRPDQFGLPLPNTTSARLARTLRLLSQLQERREADAENLRRESRRGSAAASAGRGRIPGGMEAVDGV